MGTQHSDDLALRAPVIASRRNHSRGSLLKWDSQRVPSRQTLFPLDLTSLGAGRYCGTTAPTEGSTMVDKESQQEELHQAAEGERPDEDEAPQLRKEKLTDLDVTDPEGGAVKGGFPRIP